MKWSRKLRKKLSSLNHGTGAPSDPDTGEVLDTTDQAKEQQTAPSCQDAPPAAVPFDIAEDLDAAAGGREFETAAGTAYSIELAPRDIEDRWEKLEADFAEKFHASEARVARLLEEAGVGDAAPEDFIFFDLETTGLVNTPLFLIGTMQFSEGRLQIRQWFARHYGEEPAVISRFNEQTGDFSVLVSFNGKSFDLPYTRTRAVATHTDFSVDHPHLDLLHISRRAWKDKLPDCKLQTLERHICERSRSGDIPGDQIPEAYHEYVRSGQVDRIIQILNHNVLDLLTMAELMVRMPQ